jgi:hypothetical protein
MRRMTQALPPLTQDLLDAFIASAVAWAVRLLGAVTHPRAPRRRRTLTAFVRRVERFVEHILFLKAVHAFGPPPQRRNTPRSTPPGFRRSRGNFRLFWKIAGIRAHARASLIDRVARLLHVLGHSARHVARFTRELCKGLHSALVPLAPPAVALTTDAACAVAFADSS